MYIYLYIILLSTSKVLACRKPQIFWGTCMYISLITMADEQVETLEEFYAIL